MHLCDGIQFIVVVIGVFSISEILLMLEQHHSSAGMIKETGRTLFNLKEMAHTWWATLRSSVVGFVVGVLPGAGATIASAMTYSMEKRLAGASGTFGEGDIRGVAAPEAANNASAAGCFVPMLTLGVPGSGTTAVMVGALSLYNITPGPALFTQQPALVWGLIASMFIGNVMLLFINIPLVGVFTKILQVPNWVLVPGILAVSAVGVYSVHATTFDLVLMAVLGHHRLPAAQAGHADGAADPGLRARRHDGAEPAPRAVDHQRRTRHPGREPDQHRPVDRRRDDAAAAAAGATLHQRSSARHRDDVVGQCRKPPRRLPVTAAGELSSASRQGVWRPTDRSI